MPPDADTASEDSMTAAKQLNVGSPDETALLGELAEALRRVRRGDLKGRLPRRGGMAGGGADAFHEGVSLPERQNPDVRPVSPIVGRDGRLPERAHDQRPRRARAGHGR